MQYPRLWSTLKASFQCIIHPLNNYIGIGDNQVFWVSPICHILAAVTLCFPTTHGCNSCQHHRHYLHYQHHTCFQSHTFISLSLNYIIAYTFPAESKRSNYNWSWMSHGLGQAPGVCMWCVLWSLVMGQMRIRSGVGGEQRGVNLWLTLRNRINCQ